MRDGVVIAAFLFLALPSHSQCPPKHDHRYDKTGGVIIQDIVVTGTHTLGSSEVSAITASLTGSCFDDDRSQIEEWLSAAFQDRGFFQVEVKDLRIKAADPLGVPEPVNVEAEVEEGPRCRLASLQFEGNRAFESSQLRALFPIRMGAIFSRPRISSGLESLRRLYVSAGYINITFLPDTTFGDNASVNLVVHVYEGKQYHMAKIEIVGPKSVTEQASARWELSEGAVYDQTYIERFLHEIHDLLPDGFTQARNVDVAYDCRDATVSVRIVLQEDRIVLPPLLGGNCPDAPKIPSE